MSEIVYHEGLHYMVEKEYDKAVKRFEYVLSKFDKCDRTDDAAYQIPLAYIYSGASDKALKKLGVFPEAYPVSEYVPSVWYKTGVIYHDRSDYLTAAGYFVKSAEHSAVDSQTRYRALYNAAAAYQKVSSWLEAARIYSLILDSGSREVTESFLHLKAGFCLLQASQIKEALNHFKLAGQKPEAQDEPEILYWIATCHERLQEHGLAIEEFLEISGRFKGVDVWAVTAEFEAARIHENLKQYAEAVALYKNIVKYDGESGQFGKQAGERMGRIETLTTESTE
jgi:tetratricopeptide (TPR) repeat protein